MLTKFIFKNYRSFLDEQTLSLEASHDRHLAENLTDVSTDLLPNNAGILRNLTIFGGNEAGKTNLIKALEYMKRMVLLSPSLPVAHENVPFALAEDASMLDTHLEVEMIENGSFYRYGFVLRNGEVTKEWLFRRAERLTPIFRRENESLKITGMSHSEASMLIPSSSVLFASTAENLRLPITAYIRDLKSFFRKLTFVYEPKREYLELYLTSEQYITRAVDILRKADMNFADMKLIKMGSYIDAELSANVWSQNGDIVKKRKLRLFQDREFLGKGSQHLICLLPVLFRALDEGGTVVINDLGSVLHVTLASYLQNFFSSTDVNPSGAQMIATSSMSMLMDQELRRDQIYLVSRDGMGRSSLYRLSDQKNVRKSDVYSRKYLNGDYSMQLPQKSL